MEPLNFGVLHIFGECDPGVALQMVIKLCSGNVLAAICGWASIPDKTIAWKQALDIL